MPIDLRSDTFTKPSQAMLEFMMAAKVGDDVFGEDPTVNELEEMTATIFGTEASLFCPSGTMSNQIAIKAHTQPAQEVICEATSHVFVFEGGGIAFNSGCQARTIQGSRGMITVEEIENVINPDDVHKPVSSLVVIENTANRGGGACYEMDNISGIGNLCKERGLSLHLDGARLFNALVAKQQDAKEFGAIFDSISVCLSKGLGAPVGSVLTGSADYIRKARRFRKVMGGGMRQAGYLAAAGIYALTHNISLLKQDHDHAKEISAALLRREFVGKMLPVETNIIIFEVLAPNTAQDFIQLMKKFDILCLPVSQQQVRMVLHYDVLPEMVKEVIDVINQMELK